MKVLPSKIEIAGHQPLKMRNDNCSGTEGFEVLQKVRIHFFHAKIELQFNTIRTLSFFVHFLMIFTPLQVAKVFRLL